MSKQLRSNINSLPHKRRKRLQAALRLFLPNSLTTSNHDRKRLQRHSLRQLLRTTFKQHLPLCKYLARLSQRTLQFRPSSLISKQFWRRLANNQLRQCNLTVTILIKQSMIANVKLMMIKPTAAMDMDKTSGKGARRRRYVAFILGKGFPYVVSDTDVALLVRWYTTISMQILARGKMQERRHLHLPSRVKKRCRLCISISQCYYGVSFSAIAHKHDRHFRVPVPKGTSSGICI